MNSTIIKTESFESICRTCMSMKKGTLNSIFAKNATHSLSLSDMLQFCSSISISEDDNLPQNICDECTLRLVSAYEFTSVVINTNAVLLNALHDSVLKAEAAVESIKVEEDDEDRKTKKYQCETCGKFLSNLVQHLRLHSGEKPFACDLCPKKFARSEHVAIHRRIHTGERPYTCDICNKTFIQNSSLRAHLRIHSGERRHVCWICGKSFQQSVSLSYHTRTHTGEKPHKCDICNKTFINSGNLKTHIRFHKNERPFICSVCGKRFVTSTHLSAHSKLHTGEKPYQCTLCGKAFARSEHLKDHKVVHTGQRPYACKLCPKQYSQRSHLGRHMKSHTSSVESRYVSGGEIFKCPPGKKSLDSTLHTS